LSASPKAEDWGDSICSAIILEILTWEQERKKWLQINYTTWPPRGGNPLKIQVQSGPIIKMYDTEQEAVAHTADHLSNQFQLAYSAPCYRGQLFNEIGFTGDTKCMQQILKGIYEYPPDTNLDKEDFTGGTFHFL
jgi:hypothetical protein